MEFEDAIQKCTTDLQSLLKKYPASYTCRPWGYYVNRKDFYNFQLYNYYSTRPNYHNNLFTNYKPVYSSKSLSSEFSISSWPLKSAGQVIINNPSMGVVYTHHVNGVTVID